MNGWMDEWMNRGMDGWVKDEWMNEWMDGWMNRGMDGWIDRWTNG